MLHQAPIGLMATFISLTACSAELGDREFEFDLAYLDGESNYTLDQNC
ncbi:MAG: hypothetical protein AAF511_00990 [Pseudomonadota bacterium]